MERVPKTCRKVLFLHSPLLYLQVAMHGYQHFQWIFLQVFDGYQQLFYKLKLRFPQSA